jgi:uncharacterized metal-binding protein YceD (DUF177 family)
VTPEFSRCFALGTIGTTPRTVSISADNQECIALSKRFDLVAIDELAAQATLVSEDDTILCTGTLSASVTQECVATAAPIPAILKTDFLIRFVAHPDESTLPDEIEINADDCDIIEHDGQAIDLGEAVAQTLLLALDPFPRASGYAETLRAAGVIGENEAGNSAFAGLKGLLGKA